MGCSTYLGLGWWTSSPLAPGHPTSICDIGVNILEEFLKDAVSCFVIP